MYVCGWNVNKGFKYYTLRFPVVSVQKRKQLRAHVGVLDHRQRLWVCNRCYDVDCVGGVDILGVWPEVDLRRVSCDLHGIRGQLHHLRDGAVKRKDYCLQG